MLKDFKNSIFSKRALSILGWALAILFIPAIVPEILLVLWFPVQQAVQLFQDGEAVGLLEVIEEVQPLALEALKAVLPSLGGIAGFVAATAAIRNWRVAQDRQATDLFVKASEMLGNEKSLEVRLAGIYSLERIARDFPKDHWTVIKVLASFVGERSKWEVTRLYRFPEEFKARPNKLKEDFQNTSEINKDALEALIAIGLRDVQRDRGKLWFQDASFAFATCVGANFTNTGFTKVNFICAVFSNATFVNARLLTCDLRLSRFDEADLTGAKFGLFTDLSHSIFYNAIFHGVSFDESVDLNKTSFIGVKGLDLKEVKKALNWEHAYYDPEFAKQLGLSPQDTQDQPYEPETSSETCG